MHYYILFLSVIVLYSLSLCNSIEKQLQDIEVKHSVSLRWTPSDREYMDTGKTLLVNRKEQLLLTIWKAAKRRSFLLKLKAKYAGT